MNILVNDNTPQFLTWLAACVGMCDNYMAQNYPNNPKEKLEASFGTRFIRIMKRSVDVDQTTQRPFHSSAWAFVDRTNGDVLKPATWKAPAKHSRGNIFDPQNGLGSMGPYGPAYLR